MNLLQDYRESAPFTASQLVDATNNVLRYKDTPEFSLRTLRYYIAQKVIDKPRGAPKFARYDYEHLLAIIATRMLQDRGMKLDKIHSDVNEIKSGKVERWEKIVGDWLATNRKFPNRSATSVKENRISYGKENTKLPGMTVKRIEVTPHCAIEIDDRADAICELKKARAKIDSLLKTSER